MINESDQAAPLISGNEKEDSDFLKSTALEFKNLIRYKVPAGRQQSIALTKLEECVMWCTKGIYRNDGF